MGDVTPARSRGGSAGGAHPDSRPADEDRFAHGAIRVVVCDDHAVLRAGLQRLIESVDGIDVIGTAADGHEAVETVVRLRPDVALMDLSMPRLDGVAATRRITAVAPEVRVVVLTSFHHRARIAEAMDAGAVGYLLKDATPDELVRAIRSTGDTVGANDRG